MSSYLRYQHTLLQYCSALLCWDKISTELHLAGRVVRKLQVPDRSSDVFIILQQYYKVLYSLVYLRSIQPPGPCIQYTPCIPYVTIHCTILSPAAHHIRSLRPFYFLSGLGCLGAWGRPGGLPAVGNTCDSSMMGPAMLWSVWSSLLTTLYNII